MTLSTKFKEGYFAVRNSVAYLQENRLQCLRLSGEATYTALEAIFPCDVFLQDGEMKHSFLLDEKGIPIADLYVCRLEEEAYILGYCISSIVLKEWIQQQLENNIDLEISDIMQSHKGISLDGPFAWELCAEVIGSDMLGLPYLGVSAIDCGLVFRAGITGEYGYHILIKNMDFELSKKKLLDIGKSFDLVEIDDSIRSQCILENFFFDIYQEGQYRLTPPELQQQWRLSQDKTKYPGANAILNLRKNGWNKRITGFSSKDPVEKGQMVTCGDDVIGEVIVVGFSPQRNDFVGKALLKRPYWHAGISGYKIGKVDIQTISAPAVDNLSLTINTYRDSYHQRDDLN